MFETEINYNELIYFTIDTELFDTERVIQVFENLFENVNSLCIAHDRLVIS